MVKLYLSSPGQLKMVSLLGHLDRSYQCTSICLRIRGVMCLDTRSHFLISFGMTLRLATGMKQGLLIWTLVSLRCVSVLPATPVCAEKCLFPECAAQRINVGGYF